MKNALLLHGTDATSQDNWFPWLEKELQNKGWDVWTPDLPKANKPNIKRYNKLLFSNKDWKFTNETILIGHSAGAVAILGILEQLPEDIVIEKAILVAGFVNDLGWPQLTQLFEKPFDFEKIKKRAKQFILVHSDNDPYVPLKQAEELAKKLNGQLIILKGQKHFSLVMDSKYNKFPYLLELID